MIASWIYLSAKLFMYLAFITRLYTVYNNPIYHYNLAMLKVLCISAITFTLTLCILTLFLNDPQPLSLGRNQGIIMATCITQTEPYIVAANGLYDVIFSIGSMIAFINPLRNIIKSVLRATDISMEHRKKLDELIHKGMKYFILVTVSSLSTSGLMFVIAIGLPELTPVDLVINIICLALMTPYYNKGRYYERLCCGMIACTSKCCLGCCCGYNQIAVDLSKVMVDIENPKDEKVENVEGNQSIASTETSGK